MKVAVINMEPKYKNLAIEKIRKYHRLQGHVVIDEWLPLLPLLDDYDKIYISSIFTFTDKSQVPFDDPRVITGGTGFDVGKKLPDEIERIKPKLNFGFTSRGCINNCPFCCVPEKEGHIRATNDLYDIWDGHSKEVVLYDNNILALPDHFQLICDQALALNIKIDFNQGLDARLITEEQMKLYKKVKSKDMRFAFDHPNQKEMIKKVIDMSKKIGIKKSLFYVLVNFNTTITDDFERLNYLKAHHQNACLMRYKPVTSQQCNQFKELEIDRKKLFTGLATWVNRHEWFHSMSFSDFLETDKGMRYKKHIDNLGLEVTI